MERSGRSPLRPEGRSRAFPHAMPPPFGLRRGLGRVGKGQESASVQVDATLGLKCPSWCAMQTTTLCTMGSLDHMRADRHQFCHGLSNAERLGILLCECIPRLMSVAGTHEEHCPSISESGNTVFFFFCCCLYSLLGGPDLQKLSLVHALDDKKDCVLNTQFDAAPRQNK